MRYREKPVEVEAIFLKDSTPQSIHKALEFMKQRVDIKYDMAAEYFERYCRLCEAHGGIIIPTLEGEMLASFGDYIIEGVDGEFYPCKPAIFKRTYEEVTDE